MGELPGLKRAQLAAVADLLLSFVPSAGCRRRKTRRVASDREGWRLCGALPLLLVVAIAACQFWRRPICQPQLPQMPPPAPAPSARILSLKIAAAFNSKRSLPAPPPSSGLVAMSAPLAAPLEEGDDVFLELAAAMEAEEEEDGAEEPPPTASQRSSGAMGGGSSAGGPRLSWAARAAAAGSAGAVPPGHQPRQAVLLPPGSIPCAPTAPLLLPASQPAAAAGGSGVVVFGSRGGVAGGSTGAAAAGTFSDVGQGSLVERYAGLKARPHSGTPLGLPSSTCCCCRCRCSRGKCTADEHPRRCFHPPSLADQKPARVPHPAAQPPGRHLGAAAVASQVGRSGRRRRRASTSCDCPAGLDRAGLNSWTALPCVAVCLLPKTLRCLPRTHPPPPWPLLPRCRTGSATARRAWRGAGWPSAWWGRRASRGRRRRVRCAGSCGGGGGVLYGGVHAAPAAPYL